MQDCLQSSVNGLEQPWGESEQQLSTASDNFTPRSVDGWPVVAQPPMVKDHTSISDIQSSSHKLLAHELPHEQEYITDGLPDERLDCIHTCLGTGAA